MEERLLDALSVYREPLTAPGHHPFLFCVVSFVQATHALLLLTPPRGGGNEAATLKPSSLPNALTAAQDFNSVVLAGSSLSSTAPSGWNPA